MGHSLFKLHSICSDFVLLYNTFEIIGSIYKASTRSKTRREACPRHIACLRHAILLFCSVGKCLFKVNDRSLFKNKNKRNHSLLIKDYGTPEVHLNYASVFIVDFKYVVNLALFFMTFNHNSAEL